MYVLSNIQVGRCLNICIFNAGTHIELRCRGCCTSRLSEKGQGLGLQKGVVATQSIDGSGQVFKDFEAKE